MAIITTQDARGGTPGVSVTKSQDRSVPSPLENTNGPVPHVTGTALSASFGNPPPLALSPNDRRLVKAADRVFPSKLPRQNPFRSAAWICPPVCAYHATNIDDDCEGVSLQNSINQEVVATGGNHQSARELGTMFMPRFNEAGLVSAVVQNAATHEVLMVAYMNQQAIERTVETNLAHFYSRSRQRLWQKGESSGNVLKVCSIRVDCDQDALLLLVEPAGPACHTGAASCFYRAFDGHHLAHLK